MNLFDPSRQGTMPDPSDRFADEEARLKVIRSYEPGEIEDDPELQGIVEFAAKLCDAPVSLVSLVEKDRQRFLAREGLDQRETPRDVAFCAHALGRDDMLEVPDATKDERFANNPLVTGEPHIRYYAGQPLISKEGASLGTLCIIDTEPHAEPLNPLQREGMRVLAKAAMRRLEARRLNISASRASAEHEQQLLRMIEGVPAIAWSADSEGTFHYFNKRWKEVTGEEPPKLAEDWRPFIHPEDADPIFAKWEECFSQGKPFEAEYRLLHADGSWSWVLSLAVPVAEREGGAINWFGTLTDIHAVKKALEERDLIAHELSHRIKNIFAVIIGLATLKARKSPEHEPFARELTDVLRALGRAHEFVRPGGSSLAQESLRGLLEALFAPYAREDDEERVKISGADADVSPHSATPLALVFHELATNSAKYGALSVPDGYVTLDISDDGENLRLLWREHDGPEVSEDGETGFGSRLVEMSMTGQLGGSWERRFKSDGLEVELTLSKDALAR